jgi:DNA mismatch repair protein MutL
VPRIHLLSDHLVSQIAAGEVVERPASVVKELVENALDAGATEVRVELEGGGKTRIAVSDDGCGMGREDALLAFDQHATSKIGSFEDLERVATLGFRGEALCSIAAVARVELTTAEQPGDGQRVLIEGGRIRVAEPHARPRGTTIDVRSLFFNVPARRKFLKARETELRRALEVVQGYALARPDVRFEVVHEGRTLLDALATPGTERGARERIAQIFGAAFAAALAEIPALEEAPAEIGALGTSTVESLGGFIGHPQTARGHRQFVFVNRRLLRDRMVLGTFYRAVREEWRSEDFPALFLFLDLPPEEVDVNVHPQKAEVRFRDPGLLDRLSRTLRRGLERARGEEPAPLRAPREESAAVPFAWQGLGERAQPMPPSGPSGNPWGVGPMEIREGPPVGSPPILPENPLPGNRLAAPSYTPLSRAPVPLSGRKEGSRSFRLLGQYKGTLILLEGPDGLYLIDQHVAHERILYERLRRALHAERTAVQTLLTPPLLDVGPAERLRLLELSPRLEECGFGLAALSGNTLALTAVPAVLGMAEAEALLGRLASESTERDTGDGDLRGPILDALAASLACKAAVKMHHPLAPLEMEALVGELFAAEQPYACPHGRPIVLQMTDVDLERRFGRR